VCEQVAERSGLAGVDFGRSLPIPADTGWAEPGCLSMTTVYPFNDTRRCGKFEIRLGMNGASPRCHQRSVGQRERGGFNSQ